MRTLLLSLLATAAFGAQEGKGDHNQDGHLDNGVGPTKPRLTVIEEDKLAALNDQIADLNATIVKLNAALLAAQQTPVVPVQQTPAPIVPIEPAKPALPVAKPQAGVSCMMISGDPLAKDFGDPRIEWPNGSVTYLQRVGNQGDLHGGIQFIWMTADFAQGQHRWSDTINLEPGVPQSTLAKDRP